jgi:hypothetical protein
MNTITIPKNEYLDLKTRAEAFERIIKASHVEISLVPPEKNIKKIMSAFKKTKKYSPEFLQDIEEGLARSSYFT